MVWRPGLAEATIQDVLGEENQILVRVADNIVANADELQAEVSEALPNYQFEILRSDSVSAKVGSELLWQAFYCLLLPASAYSYISLPALNSVCSRFGAGSVPRPAPDPVFSVDMGSGIQSADCGGTANGSGVLAQ